MRRVITGLAVAAAVVLTVVVAAKAHAADKAGPVDLLPPLPAVSSSTSCYVQGLAGSAVSTASGGVLPASISATGWTVGAGIGCDLKIDRVVIGALARVELPVDTDGTVGGVDFDKSWMAATRVGYMLNTGLMVYGLVGYETSELSLAAVDIDKNGLVVGGGLEVMISKHISLTAEYTNTLLNDIDAGAGLKIEPESHKARLGLTWRFQSLFGE